MSLTITKHRTWSWFNEDERCIQRNIETGVKDIVGKEKELLTRETKKGTSWNGRNRIDRNYNLPTREEIISKFAEKWVLAEIAQWGQCRFMFFWDTGLKVYHMWVWVCECARSISSHHTQHVWKHSKDGHSYSEHD